MPKLDARTVWVVPLLRLHHLGNSRFIYLVPPEMDGELHVGSVVRVPFGKRSVRAVLVGEAGGDIDSKCDTVPGESFTIKPIEAFYEDSVPGELLSLAQNLAHRYLSPHEACLRLVVPPATTHHSASPRKRRSRAVEPAEKTWVPEKPPQLTSDQEAVFLKLKTAYRNVYKKKIAALDEAYSEVQYVARTESTGVTLDDGEEGKVAHCLLWGVTGSGKTEVYLRLIEDVLAEGGDAILLVPEIALTPQMVGRVRKRFGSQVGVFHSGLTKRERLLEWRRIAAGEASVVVGARSAVFAPLQALRLIIVDESHDSSYKQEEEPRYHVLTTAKMRLAAQEGGGLLVEGTATPSVESMHNVSMCLRLPQRALGAEPSIEVVDMRRQGGGELLAPISREALKETLRKNEQAIVLLNRRGYAAHVYCEACGHVMMCKDCEASLTYHSGGRRLLCHHCGRIYFQPQFCPACEGPPLTRGAPGTERLEQELLSLVPREQVFRMDSDTATSGNKVREVLDSFAKAHPAVLVGTQMVAKGHDFSDVTLVLVADADTGLYVPDFRATERTFQLLTQVAGRAGRARKPGRVLVQTWNPEVACIRMALERDEDAFYAQELGTREQLGYPPFTKMIRLMALASEAKKAEISANYLARQLRPYFAPHEVRGPARLPAIRGRERWHLLISSSADKRMLTIVGEAVSQLSKPYQRRGVLLLADVDPYSFF